MVASNEELIRDKTTKNNKFIFILIIIVSIQSSTQVFIPFSFWQRLENCSATYCPTLNPMSASLQGTAGMTQIIDSCIDDNSILVTLPWDFHIVNTPYRNWYIGSNTYITAGAGSSVYTPINASSPALPKFHLGAGDANYRRVYTISGTNYFRVRYEGNTAFGTCGSQNLFYEATFFRPTVNYQYVQVVFGTHGQTGRPFGVADTTTYYVSTTPITQNSSYVFYSHNGGTTWFLLPNYSITGTGTTL